MGYGNDMNAASELLRQVLNLKKVDADAIYNKGRKIQFVEWSEATWVWVEILSIIYDHLWSNWNKNKTLSWNSIQSEIGELCWAYLIDIYVKLEPLCILVNCIGVLTCNCP